MEVSVPARVISRAEEFIYASILGVLRDIYQRRVAGREVPDFLLDEVGRAKAIYEDLHLARNKDCDLTHQREEWKRVEENGRLAVIAHRRDRSPRGEVAAILRRNS